jgi:hypothetical protein
VDHERGRTYESRRMSSHARMRQYLRELDGGVPLRLLCVDCDPDMNGGKR